MVCEIGSGVNGNRLTLGRILSDPDARVIVVEHCDRLARLEVEHWRRHCVCRAAGSWWPILVSH